MVESPVPRAADDKVKPGGTLSGCLHTTPGREMTTSSADDRSMVFEMLTVRKEGAVLFAEIAAPPMNLLGPELVRDLASLIRRAEADDAFRVLVFKSADPDYFMSHVDATRIGPYREATAAPPNPQRARDSMSAQFSSVIPTLCLCRHRQTHQQAGVVSAIQRPDGVDERLDIMSGAPARRERAQLVLDLAVG
jgi:hypothetical protein